MKFKDIFKAAKDGTVQDIADFIAKDADVNARGKDGVTPLHVAACHNANAEVLKYLTSKGANVHLKNKTGQTPLDVASTETKKRILREVMGLPKFESIFKAAECGNIQDIALFIENDTDINSKDKDEWAPLHFATRYNSSVKILEYIIAQGADVNAKSKDGKTPLDVATTKEKKRILCEAMGLSDVSSIFEAAKSGTIEDIVSYIENGTDVNVKDKETDTPLHYAAQYNSSVKILEYLVSQGADINAGNKHGLTPLHYAAGYNRNIEILKFLVFQGGDVNVKDDSNLTPLHYAAGYNNNIEVLEYLISLGADLNAKSDSGWTPLHMAASFDAKTNANVLCYLISQGADVHAENKYGQTPLNIAVKKGKKQVLLNAMGQSTFESIFEAARSGTVKDIANFIENGIDINVKDKLGTPLHNAVRFNPDVDVLKYLLAQGADVNATNEFGNTPLHLAARFNASTEIWDCLVSQGADVFMKNKYGQTPLDIIRKGKNARAE